MSRVLFANSYFYPLDPKQWKFRQPYPPLGTLWAAAVARELGHEVSLFDTNLRDDPSAIGDFLRNEVPKYLVIYDDGFNYLTKMCLTVMREACFAMAVIAKKAGCTVIVSSSDASDHYGEYFANSVDYVVRGEGEQTLAELLTALEEKRSVTSVAGIAYPSDRGAVLNPPRPVIKNPDLLPLPAWDLVDMSAYRSIWLQHHGYFSLNIATTRGCPFKCNWCAKPIYGNRYSSRSPKQVVEEITTLLNRYRPDHFWMSDDIFGLKPGWLKQFAQLVSERKLIFKYKIQSRVDLLLEEDTIGALASSGAQTVWVGAESGSQRILDAMDKGTTVEQIREATTLMKQFNIQPAFFLQFGYPDERWEDIQSTIRMVLSLMPTEIGISVSYPLPGTKFYEKVKADLQAKQNWSDSSDLAMMFRGTYAPAFYRILHRYVHNRYRVQRGVNLLRRWWSHPSFGNLPDARKIASMIYNIPFSILHSTQLRRIEKANPAV